MATGLSEGGGVMAPPDVHDAGDVEWSRTSGVPAHSPMVGGARVEGLGAYDVDRGYSRIVTLPQAGGPASEATGGLMATPDGAAGAALLDDWRDILNFRGSPMPWLLLLALIMVGFMELRVQARAGRTKAAAAIG